MLIATSCMWLLQPLGPSGQGWSRRTSAHSITHEDAASRDELKIE